MYCMYVAARVSFKIMMGGDIITKYSKYCMYICGILNVYTKHMQCSDVRRYRYVCGKHACRGAKIYVRN